MKGASRVSLKKRARKTLLVTRSSKPAVLKFPKAGKIKRVDIRKAVLAVRDSKALAGR